MMEGAPSNLPAKAETTNGPERSSRKSGKDDKSRRKDDKNVEQVMKALNALETTEEKLAAMCKKYTEVVDENRKLQGTVKQWKKSMNTLQREKEQLQGDHSKAVLTRSRLESLCRELQRQNKQVKEESMVKIREEEEKRKEVSAKFNTTLAEITTLMSSSNEKTNKLRDENVEITKKFKSICDQSSIQQQQVDKMNTQRRLESELTEARLTKQRLEFTAEKEILLKEKQQLLVDMHSLRGRVSELEGTEISLRAQVTLYADRYDEFQTALTKSNEVFGGFKGEMEKMSKKITRLEKETTTWKSRWEKSHQALLEMAADKTQSDGELALANRRHTQLEKLCRTLQDERVKLLAQIKSLDQTPSSDDRSVDMATADVEIAMASAAFDSAKLKSEIGSDVKKALSSFISPDVKDADNDDIIVTSEQSPCVSGSPMSSMAILAGNMIINNTSSVEKSPVPCSDIIVTSEISPSVSGSPMAILEELAGKMTLNNTSSVEKSPVPCSEILATQTALDAVDLDKTSSTNVDGVSSLSDTASKVIAGNANVATQNKGEKKCLKKDPQSPTDKSKSLAANQAKKDKTELKSSPKEKKDRDKGKPMTVNKVKVDSSHKKDKKDNMESTEEKEITGSLKEKTSIDLSNIKEQEIGQLAAVSLNVEKSDDVKTQKMSEKVVPSQVTELEVVAQVEGSSRNALSTLSQERQNTVISQTELKDSNVPVTEMLTTEKTDVKLQSVTEIKTLEIEKEATVAPASVLPSPGADVNVKDVPAAKQDSNKSVVAVQNNESGDKSKLISEPKSPVKESEITNKSLPLESADKTSASLGLESKENEKASEVKLSYASKTSMNTANKEKKDQSKQLNLSLSEPKVPSSIHKEMLKNGKQTKVELKVTDESKSIEEKTDLLKPEVVSPSTWLEVEKRGNRRSASPRKNATKIEAKDKVEPLVTDKQMERDASVQENKDSPAVRLDIHKKENRRSVSPRKNANKPEEKNKELLTCDLKTEIKMSLEEKNGDSIKVSTSTGIEVEKRGSTRSASPRKNANKTEGKDQVETPVSDLKTEPSVDNKIDSPTKTNATTRLEVEKTGNKRSPSPRKKNANKTEKNTEALVSAIKTEVEKSGEEIKISPSTRLEVEKSGSRRSASPNKTAHKAEEKDKVQTHATVTKTEIKPSIDKDSPVAGLGVEKSGNRRSASPRKNVNKTEEKCKETLVNPSIDVEKGGAKLLVESDTKVGGDISKGSTEASSSNALTTSILGLKDKFGVKNVDLSSKGMDENGAAKKSTDIPDVGKNLIAEASAVVKQPSPSYSSNKDGDKSNSQGLVADNILTALSEIGKVVDVKAESVHPASTIEVNKQENKNVAAKGTDFKGSKENLQSLSEAKVSVKPETNKKAKVVPPVNKVPTSPRKEVNKKEKLNKEEFNKTKKVVINKSNVEKKLELKSPDAGGCLVASSAPGADPKVESLEPPNIPSATSAEVNVADKIKQVESDISKTVVDAVNEEKKDDSKLLVTSESTSSVNVQELDEKVEGESSEGRLLHNLSDKAVSNKKVEKSKIGKKDAPKIVMGSSSKLKEAKAPSLAKSKVPAKVPDVENVAKIEVSPKKIQGAQTTDPKKQDASSEKLKKTENVSAKASNIETSTTSVADDKVGTKAAEPLGRIKLQEQAKTRQCVSTKADLNLEAPPIAVPSFLELAEKTHLKLSEVAPSGEATVHKESDAKVSEENPTKELPEDVGMKQVVAKKRKK